MVHDALTVALLRQVFRNLQAWRSLYEAEGIDIVASDGVELHIWDIEDLFVISQVVLSPRQSQAIRFFLVENMSEEAVARQMGIAPNNPVGMYATTGLTRLIEMVTAGAVDGRRRTDGSNALRGTQGRGSGGGSADHGLAGG